VGHNCIIHHEALTYPYPGFAAGDEQEYKHWPINTQRKNLLTEYGITAIRIHGSADEICIYDAFAEQLGLIKPIADNGSDIYSHKIFASPVPTFCECLRHEKKVICTSAYRSTVSSPHRPVRRNGLPWGGLG